MPIEITAGLIAVGVLVVIVAWIVADIRSTREKQGYTDVTIEYHDDGYRLYQIEPHENKKPVDKPGPRRLIVTTQDPAYYEHLEKAGKLRIIRREDR